ncbi:MAG: P-loop NTPase fold protein [Snowella sp.]|nr:P-loop NTPase fold protein [Snowella sp.]
MGIDLKMKYTQDLLERDKEIEILSPIIENVNSSLVLAVNAPWGTGKTTFVELWRDYLENKGLKVIFFNAWETDFAEDPLIALISTLDKWVQSLDDGYFKHKVWNDFKQKLVPKLLKRSAMAGAKLATAGILDIEKDYEKIFSDLFGEITGDLIDKFNEKSQAITQFKDVIKKVLDKLPEQQHNLIIFIDELDRCRPTYAIELLERIKHLFSVERLVFILSTDTEQLAHSIRAVYGNEFDAKKYLNRFVDLDYSLKEPDLKKYIKKQFTSLFIDDYYNERRNGGDQQDELISFTLFMANTFNFKLRDINFLITRIKLVLSSIPHNSFILTPILITLLTLRHYNETLYREYKQNPKLSQQVINFIVQSEILKNEDMEFYVVILINIISYLIIFTDNAEKEQELITQYESFIESLLKTKYPNVQEVNTGQKLLSRIGEIKSDLRWHNSSGRNLRKIVFERIELLHELDIN